MKKLLFLFLIWLYPLFSFGAINECLTDVYFGNGILTNEGSATSNTHLLEIAIIDNAYNGSIEEYKKHIGKVKEAYNSTHGWGVGDLIESLLQKLSIARLVDMASIISDMAKIYNKMTEYAHAADLDTQVKKYMNSIQNGHKVLVVAHSQGNLFAYEAYRELPAWMKNYWEAVGVASPGMFEIKEGAPSIAWDNDLVADLALNPFRSRTYCDIRRVYWDPQRDVVGLTLREPKPNSNYVYSHQLDKIYKEDWKAVEGIFEKFDFRVHSFTFYMGEALVEGAIKNAFNGEILKTDTAKIKIMEAIKTQLEKLEAKPSQWKPKNLGCLCKDKYAKMTHMHDPALMDIRLEDEKIKDFAEGAKGKIYSVPYKGKRQYVRAACGGEIIKEVDEGEVCYRLEDKEFFPFGTIEGDREQDASLPGGLFTANLTWQETMVSMKMANGLMPESVEGCGFAKLSSGDLELGNVYPGTYPIGVAAEGYEELEDEGLSDIVTLSVKAVNAKKTDKFHITKKYEYPNLGKGGHIADIVITQPEPGEPAQTEVIPTVPTSEDHRGYGSGGYGGGSYPHHWIGGGSGGGSNATVPVSRYNPPLCKSTDCACVPCEYSIVTYLNQTRLGPISGANVKLYKATDEEDANREILYEGSTTVSNKIDEAGTLTLPVPYPQQTTLSQEEQDLMDAIAGYEGDFVLEVSGGFDIDSNDDFIVDSSFTQVNGKLHLILSKERLLQNDYKVNILTEIGYQLSKDLLGENYDKVRLQARLDDIAKRVLIEKLYPDANQPLGRDDLFYWIPMAHKDWLVKPYDTTLAPIVNKVYAGEDIYYDAYDYVYTALDGDLATVPVVKSQWFKVDENISSGTNIGKIILVSEGNSSVEGYMLSGSGSTLFRVDDGVVYLEENATLDYEQTSLYQMQLRVSNGSGESKPVTLYIVVGNILDAPEDRSFTGGVISEDAIEGMIAGKMTFDTGAAPIERIEIGGADHSDFTVDLNGTIRVSDSANFDYETHNSAKITLQAFNSFGGSRVVPIDFAIIDAVDVPIVQMLDVHLEENATVGQIVGKVNILSNDPLLNVVLLGSGKENFSIDLNGTVRVASGVTLDYETRANYVLQVQANNIQGVGRPGTLIIRMDNIADVPQLGYTTFHMIEGSSIGTEVGRIKVETNGSTPITDFTLTGIGVQNFNIDTQGIITVANGSLSRSDQEFFDLYVKASNAEGESLRARVVIYIDTQRPILGVLDGYTYENVTGGTAIGSVPLVSSSSPINAIRLEGEGSEKFSIDLQRYVTIANDAVIDYENKTRYTLRVIATNEAGESDAMPLYIRVIDQADTLKIAGFSATIYEDIPAGTVIGIVSTVSLGGKSIDHYELSGTGSQHFTIDSSGRVTVAAGAQFDSTQTSKYHLALVAVDIEGVKSNQVYVDISVVKSINTIPHISDMFLTVQEDESVGTVLGKTLIVSKTQVVEQAWLIGEGSDAFEIQTDGTIKLKQNIDYELKKTYDLTMFARNGLGQSQGAQLHIDVTNIIDDEPILKDTILSIEETTTIGRVVGDIEIESIGTSAIESIILSGIGAEYFNVDIDGTVKLLQPLDYESRKIYNLHAIATNAKAESPVVDVTVNVLNVPEHVPVLKPFTASVLESAMVDSIVGVVEIKNSGDTPVTAYQLSDTSVFIIDSDGTIGINTELDYEIRSNYALQVIAYNAAGKSQSVDVNIEVINIVDGEPVLDLFVGSIEENASIGAVIGKINVLDEGNTAISHYILQGDDGKFRINPITQEIVLQGILDFEHKPGYDFTVEAVNSIGKSAKVSANISVLDRPDTPPIVDNYILSLAENITVGSELGKMPIDSRGSRMLSVTMNGDDNDTFTIENNGTIYLNKSLHYELKNRYTFEVLAVNSVGESNLASLVVNILDTLLGTNDNDIIQGNSNNNAIFGYEGNDTLYGNTGADTLKGGAGDDTIISDGETYQYANTPYADTLEGGEGDDLLQGGAGDDTYIFNRGDGHDVIYDYDARYDVKTYYNAGNDTLKFGEGIGPDDLILISKGNDLLVGLREEGLEWDELSDTITITNWYLGNNKIENFVFLDDEDASFNDTVFHGTEGDDVMIGVSNDNVMYGESGNDTITGNAGNDTINGNNGNDTLYGNTGADTLKGGAGDDIIISDGETYKYVNVPYADTLEGGEGDDLLQGGAGDDTYIFNRGDGHDVIYDYDARYDVKTYYNAGNDTLKFGEGIGPDDLILISKGNDLLVGLREEGLEWDELSDTITITNWYLGNNKIENFVFVDDEDASFNDVVFHGTEGDDVMIGVENDNVMSGQGGNDTITGNAGNDTINGDNGNDTLYGNTGADTLKGGAGDDTIISDGETYQYANTPYADTLEGGEGDDLLQGGAGDDTYIFNRGDGHDVIYDYDARYDVKTYYNAGNDTLKFGEGIGPDDLLIRSDGENIIVALKEESIEFENLSNVIIITNWYTINNRVETFVFEDGTVWDEDTIAINSN